MLTFGLVSSLRDASRSVERETIDSGVNGGLSAAGRMRGRVARGELDLACFPGAGENE